MGRCAAHNVEPTARFVAVVDEWRETEFGQLNMLGYVVRNERLNPVVLVVKQVTIHKQIPRLFA